MPTVILAAIGMALLAVGASIRAFSDWKYRARHTWPLEAALFALFAVSLTVHAIQSYVEQKPASWFQLSATDDPVAIAVFVWGE